jgi:hypothetical protein
MLIKLNWLSVNNLQPFQGQPEVLLLADVCS